MSDDRAARLRLRICSTRHGRTADLLGPTTVHRLLCLTLAEVLVVETEDDDVPLTREEAAAMGVTEAELFERALENCLQEVQLVRRTLIVPGVPKGRNGYRIASLQGDFYGAAHLHRLGAHVESTAGAIVTVPHMHQILVHEIEREVGGLLEPLAAFTAELFESWDLAVSEDLFWWLDGGLTTIERNDQGSFVLPESLEALTRRSTP